MSYKIQLYKDIEKNNWDKYVLLVNESTYHHSWSWISYISLFDTIEHNISFIVFDESENPIAICPLCISNNKEFNYREFSFGGNHCATPALNETNPSKRRKLLDYIMSEIHKHALEFEVKKIKMVSDPLPIYIFKGLSNFQNQFELIKYNFQYHVENYILINLAEEEDVLYNKVSKYQRKHIRQSEKKGLTIKCVNSILDKIEITHFFSKFKEAHYISAGKLTRPIETWDKMLEMLFTNDAVLFVAMYNNEPISFLYCGTFSNIAFGWSQVNIDHFEKLFSPRQLLEWSAIKYFKENEFKFYEIGERYFKNNNLNNKTDKEVSISVMKERFGGFISHKIFWTGYFDLLLLTNDLKMTTNISQDSLLNLITVEN